MSGAAGTWRGLGAAGVLRAAWRQTRRDLKAGEVRILLAALVLAVLAVTTIGFVTDRAQRALAMEANQLLGGDAVVSSERPIEGAIAEAANATGLRQARTVELNSMIRVGRGESARLQLGELAALGEGFPLRGAYSVVGADGRETAASSVPDPGTAWLSRAGAQTLGASVGDTVSVGELELQLAALVTAEPDAALDYFNVAPRVFLNLADLPATGLVQEGSRMRHRLVVAGDAAAVERFTATAKEALGPRQRIETIADARPEVRSALDRAGRFLRLSALVSVLLAAVAVAMAARQHSERHLSGAAVMRCLGTSQATLAGIHLGGLVMLGLLAGTVGVVLAFALQWAVGFWLAPVLGLEIPPAGWQPALAGYGVGLLVLMAFGAPPVLALRKVPALRVIRRDLDVAEPSAWLVALAGLGGLAALLWWQAGSVVVGTAMLAGFAAAFLVLALLAWGLVLLVRALRTRLRGPLRYGLANLGRRPATSIAQVASLGLGLMALLLLTFVRTDLLDRWQLQLAEEAPNRFIINVQDDQVGPVREFIAGQGVGEPVLFPMVRARLAAHNGEAVRVPETPASEIVDPEERRARRRATREFNLSTDGPLRDDNRVVAGEYWGERVPASPEISVEAGYAESLDWELGDRITFDIAGQRLEATLTSLREVDWESFRPNFFVLVSPGALDGYPASHITAVSVPPEQSGFTGALVERFPNLTVIDIDAVLEQVRGTADQVSTVVEVVFWFSMAAGVLVLMAAVTASQDERLREGGVMRTLGASRWQLRMAQASEFAAIGLLSGLVAAFAASALAGVLSTRAFDLPWEPDWGMAAAGALAGLVAALVAGLLATRRVLDAPPSVVLRELDA